MNQLSTTQTDMDMKATALLILVGLAACGQVQSTPIDGGSSRQDVGSEGTTASLSSSANGSTRSYSSVPSTSAGSGTGTQSSSACSLCAAACANQCQGDPSCLSDCSAGCECDAGSSSSAVSVDSGSVCTYPSATSAACIFCENAWYCSNGDQYSPCPADVGFGVACDAGSNCLECGDGSAQQWGCNASWNNELHTGRSCSPQ